MVYVLRIVSFFGLLSLSLQGMDCQHSLTINTHHGFTQLQESSEFSQCTACILENFTPEAGTLDIGRLCEALPNLTALFIHHIPLTRIVTSAQRYHEKLKHLEIKNTNLTELSCNSILTTFPQLRSIFIKNNKNLKNIFYPLYYSKLREIDLQDNAFTDIDLNQLLGLSRKLESINLSGNPIERIKWQPDDLEHEKAPEVILQRVTSFDAEKRAHLYNMASAYSVSYLWMKKCIPSAVILTSSIYNGVTGYGNWKVKALWYGISIPVSYCVGRIVVDVILFPDTEKKIVYFVPIYDE
jgi:Leucine-rich repeat (LRR) protein